MSTAVTGILLTCTLTYYVQTWRYIPRPTTRVSVTGKRFSGNHTKDYYQIILIKNGYLIIGGRDTMYNISLGTLEETEEHRLIWIAETNDHTDCTDKRKPVDECYNYIRLVVESNTTIFICGTNAYKPKCRTYGENKTITDKYGVGYSPFDPKQQNVFVFVNDYIYTAVAADTNNRRHFIHRNDSVTTDHTHSFFFNSPIFVKSIDYGDKVYFFFREIALETSKKTIFSRVSRVCKDDKGGNRILNGKFTSFFKARLQCTVPGEFLFYFDELQAVSDIEFANYMPTDDPTNRTEMFYGVFTTPINSISGSAVCGFLMRDVIKIFDGKLFKLQKKTNQKRVRDPANKTVTQCVNDSRKMSLKEEDFIMKHILMDGSVSSIGGAPLLVIAGENFKFTSVTIDWQVKAADDRYYNVIFIGTDDGRVLKAVNIGQAEIGQNLIEAITVFEDRRSIRQLHIRKSQETSQQPKMLIISSHIEVVFIPLHRCGRYKTCSACVALKDPYCSWTSQSICANAGYGYQDIATGKHSKCPQTVTTAMPKTDVKVIKEYFGIMIAGSAILFLIVGLGIGYLMGSKGYCKKRKCIADATTCGQKRRTSPPDYENSEVY